MSNNYRDGYDHKEWGYILHCIARVVGGALALSALTFLCGYVYGYWFGGTP